MNIKVAPFLLFAINCCNILIVPMWCSENCDICSLEGNDLVKLCYNLCIFSVLGMACFDRNSSTQTRNLRSNLPAFSVFSSYHSSPYRVTQSLASLGMPKLKHCTCTTICESFFYFPTSVHSLSVDIHFLLTGCFQQVHFITSEGWWKVILAFLNIRISSKFDKFRSL